MTTPVEVVINGRDNTGPAFKSAGGSITKIGQIAMGILTSQVFTRLAQGVMEFGKSIITEARESELVMAGLQQTLDTMGGKSGQTADSISKLSMSISEMSNFSDEAITESAGLMITFDKIGKETFPRAQQMAVDLAAKFKMDLPSATVSLSKALQGTTGSLSALSKQGVTFTDDQKKVIQALFDTGKATEAQAIIMDAIGPQVDGFAATQITAWEKVKKQVDNMKESLGTALLPVIDKVGTMMSAVLADPKVQAGLQNLTKWLGDNLPKALDFAAGLFDKLKGSGDGVMKFIKPFIPAIQQIISTFEKMRPSLMAIADLLGQRLSAAGKQLSSKVFPFLVTQLSKFSAWFAANRPLITSFIATMSQRFAFLANAIVKFWNVVQPLLSGFFDLILGLAQFVMQVSTGDWAGAWDTILQVVADVFTAIGEAIVRFLDWIAGLMGGSLAGIKKQWTTNWNLLKSILSQVMSIIGQTISAKLTAIKTAFSTAWTNIVNSARTLGSNLVSAIVGSINQAISGATSALNGFISLGAKIIGFIITGLNNAKASLVTYLKSIISGLVQGLFGSGTSTGGGDLSPDKMGGRGFASGTGGWRTVPSGFNNDNYLIGLQSGEQFAVLTPSQARSGAGGGGSTRTSTNYYNAHITIFTGKANQRNLVRGLT